MNEGKSLLRIYVISVFKITLAGVKSDKTYGYNMYLWIETEINVTLAQVT